MKERSSLYCVQTSRFLFVGMWRVCKSSKIQHPGRSGGFVLLTKGRHRPATHFQNFLLLSNYKKKSKIPTWNIKNFEKWRWQKGGHKHFLKTKKISLPIKRELNIITNFRFFIFFGTPNIHNCSGLWLQD